MRIVAMAICLSLTVVAPAFAGTSSGFWGGGFWNNLLRSLGESLSSAARLY